MVFRDVLHQKCMEVGCSMVDDGGYNQNYESLFWGGTYNKVLYFLVYIGVHPF